MKHDLERSHRQSLRLQGYDYTQPGAYFVTVCTQRRECLFGKIVDEEMQLSKIGKMTEKCRKAIPIHFPNTILDNFVVMPNHLHGILITLGMGRGTACRAPTIERFSHPVANSLPTIIRSFKSASTNQTNKVRQTPGSLLRQRNYYERVIRDEKELGSLRRYIIENPLQWALDKENPALLMESDSV